MRTLAPKTLPPDTGEDTTYDPNEGGKGNAGNNADTITFTLNVSYYSSFGLTEATLYGRKSLGNNQVSVWSPLLKFGKYGKISELLNGAQQQGDTFYIPGDFVEFGFEFNTKSPTPNPWPYSKRFWKAEQSQSEKVKSISIVVSGHPLWPSIKIDVNGRQVVNEEKCVQGFQNYWWSKTDNKNRVTVWKGELLGNNYTRFYARKAGGKWEVLLNEDGNGKFGYHLGYGREVEETFYIDDDYVEFGFEFDICAGRDWPYSGVFWTAEQSRSEQAEDIYIMMHGIYFGPDIDIYVNGNIIVSKSDCPSGTQYNWN